ncbi:MAG: PQQ-binding-like beta-propeller repeat protein [Dehalococcoidia bacterium]|nr:PQQ-binding-like beta-propeller repeat protein [Dehalococcoidia bacterium]MDD5494748.1 PQQ-binding-like beta-propeller repeat protein [Dehalococcoidia bacterium]
MLHNSPVLKYTGILLAVVLVLLGIGSAYDSVKAATATAPWPMFGNNPQHTGRSNYLGSQTNNLKWTYKADQSIILFSTPIIGKDGTLYITSHLGKLYAVRPDGSLLWTFDTGVAGTYIWASPAVDDNGVIYMGSGSGRFYAINPDGTIKWSYTLPSSSPIDASPTIGKDGTIYIGTSDESNAQLIAFNPEGSIKWSCSVGKVLYSAPAIGSDGAIYVGCFDNKLYAINPDGSLKWTFTAQDKITTSPAIGSDGTIYIGTFDAKLYAVKPDGGLKWFFNAGSWIVGSPAIGSDGTIYIGDNCSFYAINSSGNLKWQYPTGTIFSTPAIGGDGTIYIGAYTQNQVFAFRPDGSLKWNYTAGSSIASPASIGTDGTVYVGSIDGTVYAFGVTPLSIAAQTPTTATKGIPYQLTPSASGGTPPYSWSTINKPMWLMLNQNTGLLSGTPGVSATGVTFTLQVKDKNGLKVTKDLTILINPAPTLTINAPTPTTATEGVPYQLTPSAADGTAPYTWSTVNKPMWLMLDQNTGILSGTPGVSATDVTFTLQVKDKNGFKGSKDLTILINPAPTLTIIAPTPTTAIKGVPYQLPPSVSGGTAPYTWSTVNKPMWLMLDQNTGALSGTPGVSATDVTFTLSVKDRNGFKGSKDLTINIQTP